MTELFGDHVRATVMQKSAWVVREDMNMREKLNPLFSGISPGIFFNQLGQNY